MTREEQPTAYTPEQTVWVRRDMRDGRVARYRLDDVWGLHWGNVSGGVGKRGPAWSLYAYVVCNAYLEGNLAHSGVHGECPHKIKVCVLKKDNASAIYAGLAARAGDRPPRRTSCAEDALAFVAQRGEVLGPELREYLFREGHEPMRISEVLPGLERRRKLLSRWEGRAKAYRLPAQGSKN